MLSDKKLSLITSATCGIGFETALQIGLKDVTVVIGGRTRHEAMQHARMEIVDCAKTGIDLSLVGQDGLNGKFIHLGKELPW